MNRIAMVFWAAFLTGFAALPAAAEGDVKEPAKLKHYGDLRLRAESDWDSLQFDGTERPDRDRLRVRFRLGFNYTYDEHISFGGRLRTGNPQDQQSPHQTLGDEFESKAINIDKAFIQGVWKRGWVWAGKNSFPFWTHNELFWDEDVNPEGLAAGLSFSLGERPVRLRPTVGYFVLEGSGSTDRFGDKSHLAAAQLALDTSLRIADLTAAAGFYSFSDNPETMDTALADLDYGICVVGIKAAFNVAPKPWSLGVDYMRNTKSYASAMFNADQKTGYVLGVSVGQLRARRDWLIGYSYAHIEKFAVVARLAQDDWLRWGSATDTRSSNFEGHELRLAYAFGPSWNVMLRLYQVKGIEIESPTAVSREDGNRARLDFNIAF